MSADALLLRAQLEATEAALLDAREALAAEQAARLAIADEYERQLGTEAWVAIGTPERAEVFVRDLLKALRAYVMTHGAGGDG